MPEQGVYDFTAVTDGLKTSDNLHMQRLEGGVWVDYRINNYGLYGDNWQTIMITGRGVGSALVTPVAIPSTDQIIVVMDAYAIWHPGTTNDDADVTVILTCGGINPFYGLIKASATANANHIRAAGNFDYFTAEHGLQLSQSSTSTSDGSYDVFLRYIVLPFPS